MNILNAYRTTLPCAQNAIDIFAGEWSSALPSAGNESLQSGKAELFADPRVAWANDQFGGFRGMRVLELGPLEGGHSYQLQQLGAASITAIEANTRAYLKTLVTKEIYGLSRLRVQCGDFREYLRATQETFDLVFASGVLYHMTDPVELLTRIAARAPRLFLWTHYFDEAIISRQLALRRLFNGSETHQAFGRHIHLYRRNYRESLRWAGFCGAGLEWSHWMERSDILWILRKLGYQQIHVHETEADTHHPNGPSLLVAAIR